MIERRNVPSEDPGRHPRQIDRKNYATHKKVREQVEGEFLREVPEVIGARQEFNNDIQRYWDVWDARHNDTSRLYEGQSDLYMPQAKKIVETLVEQVSENLFPKTGIIDIKTNDEGLEIFTEHLYRLFTHYVEQAEMELQVAPLIRQALIAGFSPVKTEWMTRHLEDYSLQPQLTDAEAKAGGGQVFGPSPNQVFMYDGPTFQVVDLTRWYIWPTTVQNMSEAHMIFELVPKKFRDLKEMERMGIFWNVDRLKKIGQEGHAGDVESQRRERVERHGLSLDQEKKRKKGIYEITEIWTWMPLPSTNGREVPVQIVSYGNHVLLVRQNPFWHQRPPYLGWRVRSTIDNFYGQGIIQMLEHPQYAHNALINLMLDNAYWQNAPMMAVHSQRLMRDPESLTIAPQQIVETAADPQGIVDWWRPPDTINNTFFAANSISGAMQDQAGTPPIIQGNLGSRDTTATQARILEGGASAGVRAMTRSLELQVMSPWLKRTHRLNQQFMAMRKQADISKMDPLQIPYEVLASDHLMRWLTSSQALQRAQEQQVQTQLQLPGGQQPQQAQQAPPGPASGANNAPPAQQQASMQGAEGGQFGGLGL